MSRLASSRSNAADWLLARPVDRQTVMAPTWHIVDVAANTAPSAGRAEAGLVANRPGNRTIAGKATAAATSATTMARWECRGIGSKDRNTEQGADS